MQKNHKCCKEKHCGKKTLKFPEGENTSPTNQWIFLFLFDPTLLRLPSWHLPQSKGEEWEGIDERVLESHQRPKQLAVTVTAWEGLSLFPFFLLILKIFGQQRRIKRKWRGVAKDDIVLMLANIYELNLHILKILCFWAGTKGRSNIQRAQLRKMTRWSWITTNQYSGYKYMYPKKNASKGR